MSFWHALIDQLTSHEFDDVKNYSIELAIQPHCVKSVQIRTRKTSVFRHFSRSAGIHLLKANNGNTKSMYEIGSMMSMMFS